MAEIVGTVGRWDVWWIDCGECVECARSFSGTRKWWRYYVMEKERCHEVVGVGSERWIG